MARVYAIASAKGGVGKTTTTANLGATLADTGASVVVIDGDIGMANLGAALGVSPDGATLHDALSGAVEPAAAAYEGPVGLTVIPGDTSLDSFAAADPQRLDSVVEAFADVDYILIDVGAGISHETSIPLSVADAVVLVSTAERDALVDTEKTRQLTERLGGVVAGAVITRIDEATPIEEVVSGTLTANILTTIPDDEAVRESIAVGEPLVSYAPHSEAAAAYRELATQLTGRTPTTPEAPSTDLAAETRNALEASDDQLSDSLSETDITIDAGSADDGSASRPASKSTRTANESTQQTGEKSPNWPSAASDDTATKQPSNNTATDEDHNVVNPFAARPEAEPTEPTEPPESAESAEPAKSTSTDGLTDDESKWAEAATGALGNDTDAETDTETDTDTETEPTHDPKLNVDRNPTPQPTDDDESSVPNDAIPFGGGEDGDGDEDTAETTVLGAALGTDVDEAVEKSSTDPPEENRDEPLIPDAEETAATANHPDQESEGNGSDEGDTDAEDDEDEKKGGFFSRFFR